MARTGKEYNILLVNGMKGITQQLRVLPVLTEDPGSVPTTQPSLKTVPKEGYKNGSALKNTRCSSKGPGFKP